MLAPEPIPELVAPGQWISIDITGTPAPQGSKKAFVRHDGRAGMKESSAGVRPWRNAVIVDAYRQIAAHEHQHPDQPWQPLTGPIRVQIRFYTRRPKSHYGTGRNAGVLKSSAPRFVATTPDVDKLLRSTFDGLKEASVYRDDALVVKVTAEHLYANTRPGAFIYVDVVDDPGPDLEARR